MSKPTPTPTPTEVKILEWMKNHLTEAREQRMFELINMYGVGEVNTTLLCSDYVYEELDDRDEDEKEAILIDEEHELHHVIWDAVLEATMWYENKDWEEENEH